MSDHTSTPTPYTRTSTRKHGKRLTNKERIQAQDNFLKAYALNGNIMLSCKRANIDRSTFYQWLEHDTEFSICYHEAEKDFADLALAEFRKRAMEGYEKPVISMGRMVYEEIPLLDSQGKPLLDSKGKPVVKHGKPMMERVVSDSLLSLLVKRHFPEFREKQQVDVTTTNSSQDTQAIHTAIAQALASYPEAKIAVAEALIEMEKVRERH
jgi:hypothetical protein